MRRLMLMMVSDGSQPTSTAVPVPSTATLTCMLPLPTTRGPAAAPPPASAPPPGPKRASVLRLPVTSKPDSLPALRLEVAWLECDVPLRRWAGA